MDHMGTYNNILTAASKSYQRERSWDIYYTWQGRTVRKLNIFVHSLLMPWVNWMNNSQCRCVYMTTVMVQDVLGYNSIACPLPLKHTYHIGRLVNTLTLVVFINWISVNSEGGIFHIGHFWKAIYQYHISFDSNAKLRPWKDNLYLILQFYYAGYNQPRMYNAQIGCISCIRL